MADGTRSKLGWTMWGLGWLLKLAFAGTAVLLPLAGVWIASSLAAHLDGPLWASIVAGALCFPVLPLGWDLLARWRRRRRGVTRPPILTAFDRLVLRTLVVNLVFVGGLLALFPASVYEAVSTRGDWMLRGSTAPWAERVRSTLFETAERTRWLHEATHENAYEELIDPALTRTRDEGTAPVAGDRPPPSVVEPSAPEIGPEDLYRADGWPFAPTLHPAVLSLPPEAETSISSVAAYLAAQEPDPVLRVKALHDYVADRVAYDVPSYLAGEYPPQDAQTVFERRTSVCAGYATLLAALGEAAGLEIVVVVGDARGDDGLFEGQGHAWNAVNLGGRWYLIDATWDSGGLSGDRFVKEYSTDYLLTPPEVFVASHMPEDPKWQLLPTPLTHGDFLRVPHLRPGFAALALELQQPQGAWHSVRAGETLTLQLANPHGFEIDGSVRRPTAATGERCELDEARTSLSCRFPDAGRKELLLFGPQWGFLGQLYVDVR
ncbi:MAG: transglutaminase domain-containing protein [Nannocystaceae bacterium]